MASNLSMPVELGAEVQMDDATVQTGTSQHSHRSSRNSSSQTPKRRSARVEKPRSVHASPRAPERRRTMTSTRSSYATLEDHYRAMFGTSSMDNGATNTSTQPSNRPVSWHPYSARFSSSFYQSSSSDSSNHSQDMSSQSANSTSEPQPESSPGRFVPSDMQPGQRLSEPNLLVDSTSGEEDMAWSSFFGTQMPIRSGPPSYSAIMDEPTSWLLPEYTQPSLDPPRYSNLSAYRYQTSNFLPIQHPPPEPIETDAKMGDAEHTLARQNSRELIGMGLYDDPETTPFNLLSTIGKGLKLEEEWQPPEDMINDSEDADGENDSSEDEEDDLPKPPPAPRPAPSNIQGAPRLPLVNMSGQSFLFDDADDDTITSEWWYQMKQSNAAAKDPDTGRLGWMV